MHPKLSFFDKNVIISGEGLSPSTTPYPSTPTALRRLLTEILNIPLVLIPKVDRFVRLQHEPRAANRLICL